MRSIEGLQKAGGATLKARVGIEPTHKGFADLRLTTWLPSHTPIIALLFYQIKHFFQHFLNRAFLVETGGIRMPSPAQGFHDLSRIFAASGF